jgi:hypothetical protein
MLDDPYARFCDPDVWTFTRSAGTILLRTPHVGEIVGYRYSAWRVSRTTYDADLASRDVGPQRFDLELVHVAGPRIDGEDQIVVSGEGKCWRSLGQRFRTCSCHGHPWPCQDYDRDVLAATLGTKARRELAGAAPGVCASCREPFTDRQQRIVFPEPSLIVPGAAGPVFHARRHDCWIAAWEYETKKRLLAHPEVTRLASCPGAGFVHAIGLRFECTAGPACTDLHGPHRKDQGNCATRTYEITDMDHYERPISDCGYRPGWGACLGAETGPHQPSELRGLFGGQ